MLQRRRKEAIKILTVSKEKSIEYNIKKLVVLLMTNAKKSSNR